VSAWECNSPGRLDSRWASSTEPTRFLEDLKEPLAKFGLEDHQEKARLIEFGRYAAKDRQQCGAGKPETFTFLSFTHYGGRYQKTDSFTVGRIRACY
jgi:RNA-directed DNA polymerase